MWTDDLVPQGSVKNLRLVYLFFSNFLLIRQCYNCNQENCPNHQFLSLYLRVLTQLPENAMAKFQLVKYNRWLFSCQLIDYIFNQISRGVTFLEISKVIAQLHVNEYCSLYTVYQETDAYQNGLQNSMNAFSSSDKITFTLDVYTVRKEQHMCEMEKHRNWQNDFS